jgi:hypothetical protein
MPAMTAKAANRLPLTPKRKPLSLELDCTAICPLPRLRYLEMFPRAAVSLYPVNKFGTGRGLRHIFGDGLLAFDGFFPRTENGGQKQKAGIKAGLPQFTVENAQYRATTGLAKLKR